MTELVLSQPTKLPLREIVVQLLKVVGGSLFIALCSQVKIPLGFTPVPLTLQTLAVMLVGGFLGSRNGAMSALFYLAQLTMGLPFAAGGSASTLALIGPTGGYLAGFVLQAYLIGWAVESNRVSSSAKALAVLAFSALVQLSLGTVWLSAFTGFESSLALGMIPFIPGELLKCVAAATALKKLQKGPHS